MISSVLKTIFTANLNRFVNKPINPVYLTYTPTWRCNSRCIMCSVWKKKIADDTDWFYTLEERGFRFKRINKAVVSHFKNPIKRLFRFFIYAKEHAYVHIKHKKGKRILSSISFQIAQSFFSALTAFFLIVYRIFYKIKFTLVDKQKKGN